jgi:hypothetical protein
MCLHTFICVYIHISLYIYIYIYMSVAGKDLAHGLGWLATCCDGPAARRGVQPACQAGCRNGEKHENVTISESSWIQKLNTEGMR